MAIQIEQITVEQIRAGQLAMRAWASTAFPLLVEAVRINFPLCNKYGFFFFADGPRECRAGQIWAWGKAVRQ